MNARLAWSSEAAKRRGNSSRCCVPPSERDPSSPPLIWVDFVDAGHARVMELEQFLASLAPFVRPGVEATIDALFDRATTGELWEATDTSTEIRPITQNPELYEFRVTVNTTALRFYHGEPTRAPDELWKLHRHIKVSKKAQQVEIDYAARRYEAALAGEV